MLTEQEISRFQTRFKDDEDRLPLFFNALSDSSRYKVFKLLLEHREICVTEVSMIFGISVPSASQQLKILETSGLIRRERHGQMVCYAVRMKDPIVRLFVKIISKKLVFRM